MSKTDNDVGDASRPFFNRREGEIGLYVNIYEAKALDPSSVGSDQFFRMDLLDKLYDRYKLSDTLNFKLAFEKKKVFKGVYLERFEKGIVLAVGFDDTDALQALWKLIAENRLSNILQDVLISTSVLKSLGVASIKLSARAFEDEYASCKNELLHRNTDRVDIHKLPKDMAILTHLQTYQKKLNDEVQKIKEVEDKQDKKLGEFLYLMREILPDNLLVIKSLKEFETYLKVAKGNPKGTKTIAADNFVDALNSLRTLLSEIEQNVCHRLLQIHNICETETQHDVKLNIWKVCRDAQNLLLSDVDLQKVCHPQWSKKVLRREHGLYRGLISLIPLTASAVIDLSYKLDEYIADFPVQQSISKHTTK